MNEVEAYDHMRKTAWWKCLNEEKLKYVNQRRQDYYCKLPADLKKVADVAWETCKGYVKPAPIPKPKPSPPKPEPQMPPERMPTPGLPPQEPVSPIPPWVPAPYDPRGGIRQ